MAGMQSTIDIKRPVEAVYGFFLDLERSMVRTDPKVESVVKLTDGPIAPGTTFRIRQPVLGKPRDQVMRVLSVDPNRRIDMEAEFGPVRPLFSLPSSRPPRERGSHSAATLARSDHFSWFRSWQTGSDNETGTAGCDL
jgi:hypothetical protein